MADKPGVASSFPDHCFDNDGNLDATGAADTYAVKTGRRIFGLYKGLRFCARIPVTNTGASTMAVDEAPAVAIRKAGNAATAAGDLVAGTYYDFIYDDVNGVLQVAAGGGPPSSLTAGGGIDISGGIVSTTIKRRSIADITAGDTVTTADRAMRVRVLSGTGTLAFQPLATLGNGFWCIIQNAGTGDVTLNPDGAETIDGLASWVLYPGGVILLQVTASDITSVLLSPMYRTFTVDSTFTTPGVGMIVEVECIGGGGSGARGATGSAGGGGGGGGYNIAKFARAVLSASVSITIATGGAARSVNTAGDAGANTTFGAYLTGYGGRGGSIGTSGVGGGGGGTMGTGSTSTGGAPNPTTSVGVSNSGGGGANGGSGSTPGGAGYMGGGGGGGGDATPGRAGGPSMFGGGGGGGGGDATSGGAGGASQFAGAGGAGSTGSTAATAGTAPGGGGGGSLTGNSGAGAIGRCVVKIS